MRKKRYREEGPDFGHRYSSRVDDDSFGDNLVQPGLTDTGNDDRAALETIRMWALPSTELREGGPAAIQPLVSSGDSPRGSGPT